MSVSRRLRESVLKTGWSWGLYTPPDRRVLDAVMTAFSKREDCRRVLFVGVKAYNQPLRDLFSGRTFATIDPTPEVARYGGDPHWIDVLENIDRHAEPESFDLVVMNGVIGFGLNDPKNVEKALSEVFRVLRPGGHLMLGINERIPTHVPLGSIQAMTQFRPRPFELFGTARHVVETPFREETHTFEFYEKP